MKFLMLGFWLMLLPLAARLHLTIPLLYAMAMTTVCYDWYLAHTALADGIFLASIAITALFWLVKLIQKIRDLLW